MNSSDQSVFKVVFGRSVNSIPFVFRKLNQYFAFYWIPPIVVIISVLSFLFGPIPFKVIAFNFLDKMFTVFIVPYWVYVEFKQGATLPFWDFIKENVTPFIINYIKVFFIILASPLFGIRTLVQDSGLVLTGKASPRRFFHLFILLSLLFLFVFFLSNETFFGVPKRFYWPLVIGIGLTVMIKTTVDYMLIMSTSLFEEDKNQAVKEAFILSRNSFWFIFFMFIFVFPITVSVFPFILKMILFFLSSADPVQSSLKDSMIYILNFYLQGFIYIFITHLYFRLKEIKS